MVGAAWDRPIHKLLGTTTVPSSPADRARDALHAPSALGFDADGRYAAEPAVHAGKGRRAKGVYLSSRPLNVPK